MAQNLDALREELSTFLTKKYDEGLIDRNTFEEFQGLQSTKDHKKEGFSMVADVLTIFCKDAEKIIADMYQHVRPSFSIVKLDAWVHQLTGSSKSVGSSKITEGCKAFKEARAKFDLVGCSNVVDQISREYQRVKPAFLHIIKLERQIHDLIIAQPPSIVRPRVAPPTPSRPNIPLSPPPASRPKVSLPPSTSGRPKVPLPPRTSSRRRV